MPTGPDVLAKLTRIAREMSKGAIGWHVVLGACLLALARGWNPSARSRVMLFAGPLGSVSAAAWLFGNPFSRMVFLGLGALVAVDVLAEVRDHLKDHQMRTLLAHLNEGQNRWDIVMRLRPGKPGGISEGHSGFHCNKSSRHGSGDAGGLIRC